MHHSAAEDFQPVLALAEPYAVLIASALDVDFERWLGEREVRRAKPHLDVIDLEERLAELLEDPLEVPEVRPPVDHQAFDLMEHRRVGLVGIAAVGATGADHPDRRFLAQHGADLHRRGVGAQQQPRAVRFFREEERVVHVPRRMARREIEQGEIVLVGLDVGSFRDRESHVGEDRREFVVHLRQRMHAAHFGGRLAHRQGDVDRLGIEPRIERLRLEQFLAGNDRGAHLVFQPVDERPMLLALLGAHRAEPLQQLGDRPLLAERGDPHAFERGFIRRGGDGGEDPRFELAEFGLEIGHGLARSGGKL